MARKAKKKAVHWSKQPRAKLVSMVKRQTLQIAKLKLQLAEARETKLLNARTAIVNDMRNAPAYEPMKRWEDPRDANMDQVAAGKLFPWERD